MQKFLSFCIAIAILYGIFQMKTKELEKEEQLKKPVITEAQPSTSPTEIPPVTGNFIEKTLSNVLINILKTEDGKLFFENIIQPMNQPLAGGEHSFKINNSELIKGMFRINSFGEGSVGPASCGHIVTAHYQIFDINNSIIEDQTKTFTLGARSVLPGLDSVIVGMMIGQTRQATLQPKYAYKEAKYRKAGINPDSPYKVSVVLKEILPHNFVKSDEVKIFDDEIAYKTPLMCGERTSFDAIITRLSNGKVLYDSTNKNQKISMIIGDLNYPLIFSYALHNKIPVGARTVIAKGKSFRGLATGMSKIFPKEQLPADEYFMLELKNFSE